MKALPRAAAWSVPTLVSRVCLVAVLAWLAGCSGANTRSEQDAEAPVTAANSCAMRVESCNSRDDDCDGIIDEEADMSCGLAHALATCVRGTCVVERCSNGYFNCNSYNADGCEAKVACGQSADAAIESNAPDAAAPPSMSQQTGTPDMPSAPDSHGDMPDASMSTPVDAPQNQAGEAGGGQAGEAGGAGQAGFGGIGGPGGEAGRAVRSDRPGQAGAGGTISADPDIDGGTDETGTASTSHTDPGGGCAKSAPTGQGADCDRCVCESCAEALDNCTGTEDDSWNMLCGDMLRCFGTNVQAGKCTGDDTDCFQNGAGPCAEEFRSAFVFARSFVCTSDPVTTPCGGLTRLRLECYANKCAKFCKS